MSKKFYLLICFSFLVCSAFCQLITVSDTLHQINGAASPFNPSNDYTYGQTIYLQSEIQGSGTITALTYYYAGNKLTNSDSITIYMKNSGKKYFLGDGIFVDINSFQTVFNGKITYSTIPGPVTITLNQSFAYNSDGNLIIAVNEPRPGNDFVVASTPTWFNGYSRLINNHDRSYYITDLNQINPVYVQNQPPFTYTSPGGTGGLANVTLHGLTPLPCQSPKNIRFTNINHDNAKVLWHPPANAPITTQYDLYYSTNDIDPTISSSLPFTNISDTQQVITGLQPTTNYKVWLRSSCGGGSHSVWTLVDSFKTICAPTPIPTLAEQFDVWLPNCWATAVGQLTVAGSQLLYADYTASQYWSWREWRNVTGSTNKAANTSLSNGPKYYWLVSPPYDLGSGNNKSIEFDMALTQNYNVQPTTLDNDDTIAVVISTDNGTTWRKADVLQIWTASQTIAFNGQHVIIPLGSYSGVIRIGFYSQSQTYTGTVANLPRIFVDNVKLSVVQPVTLLSFTGQKQDSRNLLQWRTATEQNNRGFELQKLANGIDFISIAFVPTKASIGGNSTALLSYNYSDTKPFTGNNYYRLRQIDFDGKSTLSNVVLIKGSRGNELMLSAIYPNPTSKTLHVVINAPTLQTAQLLITDLAGRSVQQQTTALQSGDNNLNVNVVPLAKGVYILKLLCSPANDGGCEAAVGKFVKE